MSKGYWSIQRRFVTWLLLGLAYYGIEGLWRIKSANGYASVWMLAVGGLCGIVAGSLNQFPKIFKLKIVWQCLIGAIATLLIEFASGCIFNLLLGWNIWDYTGIPGNILGQVCPQYGIIWFLLMPFAIWLEDRIQVVVYDDYTWNYTLRSIYIDLFRYR